MSEASPSADFLAAVSYLTSGLFFLRLQLSPNLHGHPLYCQLPSKILLSSPVPLVLRAASPIPYPVPPPIKTFQIPLLRLAEYTRTFWPFTFGVGTSRDIAQGLRSAATSFMDSTLLKIFLILGSLLTGLVQ